MKKATNKLAGSPRSLKVNVKSARGRKVSSTRWLHRQLNDPYVTQAKLQGYRSRSAFKLIELDDKFKFLRAGAKVIDLGCAPGGWSQIAAIRTNSANKKERKPKGIVLGLDLRFVEPISGVDLMVLDFLHNDSATVIKKFFCDKVDVVMSDMASPSCGHKKTDHLRIVALCESAARFSYEILNNGGTFVAKVLAGGAESNLQTDLKKYFNRVYHFKPMSSRSDSSEKFVVAIGFKRKESV